VESGRSGYRSW